MAAETVAHGGGCGSRWEVEAAPSFAEVPVLTQSVLPGVGRELMRVWCVSGALSGWHTDLRSL